MSNPSKKKGTEFENEVLELLKPIFPRIKRAQPGNPSCEFVNVPFPIEAKHRKAWSLREWIRKIRRVAPDYAEYTVTGGEKWMIIAADGDRRRSDSVGTVVVFPTDFAVELLAEWISTEEWH